MWETKDFLQMMQANTDVFGTDIFDIEGASEKYCIKYFENCLSKLLDCWVILNYSKFYDVKASGMGGIEDVKFKGFGLTAKQCVDIANTYLICKIYYKKTYDGKFEPTLTPEQSREILEQITAWQDDNPFRCTNEYCSARGWCKGLSHCVDEKTREQAKKKNQK